MQIATEVAGQTRGVKIRIRGIGSGFFEVFNQELQEPLHFNVSAENEEYLAQAVEKVRELVTRVKAELESQPQSHSFKGGHNQQFASHAPSFGAPSMMNQAFPLFRQQFAPMPSFAPQAPRGAPLPPPPPN